VDLFPLGLAAGICGAGRSGIHLAARLAKDFIFRRNSIHPSGEELGIIRQEKSPIQSVGTKTKYAGVIYCGCHKHGV